MRRRYVIKCGGVQMPTLYEPSGYLYIPKGDVMRAYACARILEATHYDTFEEAAAEARAYGWDRLCSCNNEQVKTALSVKRVRKVKQARGRPEGGGE